MKTASALAALLLAMPLAAATNGGPVTIDGAGNIWRTGSGFVLTTPGAFQITAPATFCATQQLSPFDTPTAVTCNHAYVIKQDAGGNVLYASYLAGSSDDGGTAIATDGQGNVYVTGFTYSTDFPVTAGAAQTNNAGPTTPKTVLDSITPFGPVEILPGGDVFVTKFAPDGTLLLSTLVGGSATDVPTAIGVDAAGSVYVIGTTASSDFPTTSNAMSHGPLSGTFLFRLNPQFTALTYSTYSDSTIQAFDTDARGTAYLTGVSLPAASSTGPYVTAIDTVSGTVLYSTFLPDVDATIVGSGAAIAVTGSGNVFLGVSPAPHPSPLLTPQPPVYPLGPSFLVQLSPAGSSIVTETDFSSTQFDSLKADSAGNIYAFGHGTGPLPAGAIPSLLAQPCSMSGGAFVVEMTPAAQIQAATYLRQGSPDGAYITTPGHILLFRGINNGSTVALDLTAVPEMNFGCPVNLASGAVGLGVAPGEIFAVFGSGIGPTVGVSGAADASGRYPTSLAGVQLLINGTPAPLLFAQGGEIHAVAPFGLQNEIPVSFEVQYGAGNAPGLDAPEAYSNPAAFMIGGQGAILNQDGTVNTPANPAKLGTIVSIYATGTGYLLNPSPDGEITPIPPPYILVQSDLDVTFAGVDGSVVWAGSAPGLIAGVTQINARLPAALPAGTVLAAVPVLINLAGQFSPPFATSVAP